MKQQFFLFFLIIGIGVSSIHTSVCGDPEKPIEEHAIEGLGDVAYARVGAWASLAASAAVGTFLTHKTLELGFAKVLSYIPLISDVRKARLAMALSATLVAPVSTVACMKYGKLFWYFFYIIYAGERISPLLARRALNDLHVYIQHLNTIKQVQKELKGLIEQINQTAQGLKKGSNDALDPFLIAALESLVVVNEQYVKEVLVDLQAYLSEDDTLLQAVLGSIKRGSSVVTSGLQQHAQAVVQHLQRPEDLGYDATLLNLLVKELIDYWQNYTIGLAQSIDVALQNCHTVHATEQFVVTVLDRPLAFI